MLMYSMNQNVRNEVIPCFLPLFEYQMLRTNSESMFLGFRILYFIIQNSKFKNVLSTFRFYPLVETQYVKNLIREVVLSF